MVVVNAANIAKDFAWLKEQRPPGVDARDRSDETALLAVQGPRAADVLRGHVPDAVLDLGYYRFLEGRLFGVPTVDLAHRLHRRGRLRALLRSAPRATRSGRG